VTNSPRIDFYLKYDKRCVFALYEDERPHVFSKLSSYFHSCCKPVAKFIHYVTIARTLQLLAKADCTILSIHIEAK
jgi:hypothetical protein